MIMTRLSLWFKNFQPALITLTFRLAVNAQSQIAYVDDHMTLRQNRLPGRGLSTNDSGVSAKPVAIHYVPQ